LSPLLWLTNWLNYLNGTTHLSTRLTGFTGQGTWEQVSLASRPQPRPSPAVLARGTLGMLDYDATKTLPKIHIPTLVIAGDRDPLCKPSASEFIQQNVPSAQLSMLSPARHMGNIEHHTRFAQLVADFVPTALGAQKSRR
jgi:pimeloyl-ACP methyl ester carboxylesterase